MLALAHTVDDLKDLPKSGFRDYTYCNGELRQKIKIFLNNFETRHENGHKALGPYARPQATFRRDLGREIDLLAPIWPARQNRPPFSLLLAHASAFEISNRRRPRRDYLSAAIVTCNICARTPARGRRAPSFVSETESVAGSLRCVCTDATHARAHLPA
eukprot:COSAG02_NODE_49_length_45106_cov_298.436177_13_plen_159_part_00